MEVVHARCAGLDVHKKTVVAAARIQDGGPATVEVETFPTTTSGLLELSTWLSERGITHVAMEATGVYWKPVWHILSDGFELLLANAAQVKNVPGRKTDVNDAVWLSELHAHGLIRGSFTPPTEIQDLRVLVRTRTQMVRERGRHVQRIHKVLEDANIKLTSFITDVIGANGRRVLNALAAGTTDPKQLLGHMKVHQLKATREELLESLRGHVREHHRFMLQLHLSQLDAIGQAISDLEARIEEAIEPFRYAEKLVMTVPGVGAGTAHNVIAQLGVDMSRFPDAKHLRSWARICPRSDESAGKRRSTRIMPGSNWLKTALVQAAWGAVRVKDSYLRERYYRLKSRGGPKKAIVAVAAKMLDIIYYMLRDGTEYQELGAEHFDRLDRDKAAERLVKKLKSFGYEVEVRKAA